MDVEHSVDRLLADKHIQQVQPSGYSSIGSRGQQVLQPLTQLRRSVVRGDGQRQLLVRFESPAAAHMALTWAAQLTATSAAAAVNGDNGSCSVDLMVPAIDAARGAIGVGWLDQEDARNNSSVAQKQHQQVLGRFAGDWLVDLLHVALHCAVAAGSSRATQG